MNFEIPVLSPPSPEEQRAWAEHHLAIGRPFRVDAWPDALREHADRLIELPLSAEERFALITMWSVVHGDDVDSTIQDEAAAVLTRLEDRVLTAVDYWDEGVFVRLNTRSPKDNFDWVDAQGKPRALASPRQVIFTLLGSEERVFEDLQAAHLLNAPSDPSSLVLRPYATFEPWREVRVFIERSQIAGISQYFHAETFAELPPHVAAWQAAIRGHVASLLPLVPWESFTLDGWMDTTGTFRFLEVNPPVSAGVTDPALFRDGRLDGTFRIRPAVPTEK